MAEAAKRQLGNEAHFSAGMKVMHSSLGPGMSRTPPPLRSAQNLEGACESTLIQAASATQRGGDRRLGQTRRAGASTKAYPFSA